MKIVSLELENFSSYYGKHKIDFNNKFNLIGGENGAGKSSILRGLIWCLFGYQMFDSNYPTKKYKKFVQDALNQDVTNFFSVTVVFEVDNINYSVFRKMNLELDKEECLMYKNNILVPEIEILENYSPKMIEAYFFDGEKVLNNIVDQEISDFVNNLVFISFNLDTFERLQLDLNSLKKRQIKSQSNEEYLRIVERYQKLNKKKLDSDKKIAKINDLLEETLDKIKVLEQQMDQKNVLSNKEMEQLSKEHDSIKNKITITNQKLKIFVINKLDKHLLLPTLKDVTNKLEKNREFRLNEIKTFYQKTDLTSFELTDYIDPQLEHKLFKLLKDEKEYIYDEIYSLISVKQSLQRQEIKLRELLDKSDEGRIYISEVDNYESLIEKEKKGRELLKKEVLKNDELNLKLNSVINEKEEEEELITTQLQADNAIVEAEKLQNVVESYLVEQSSKIYKELSQVVFEVYTKLSRKKDVVTSIQITEESVILYSNNRELNIQALSSGEKQMLIVSLIIGVIKLADNDLPLILDTFFGRLDASHTKKLINFLKNELNNQIIFLTTNKEITAKEYQYFEKIDKKEYLLINNNGKTTIKGGFFTYEN